MTFDLQSLVRKNIRDLNPYSSARHEFEGSADVFLDANENAFGSPAGSRLNRYPDPLQVELKDRIASMNQVLPSQIFVGNGSDEAIDLLFRIFCEPGRDEVIICPPTYGMYRVSANINDVAVKEVNLTDDFQLNVPAIFASMTDATKLIFICSPNNPTGNLIDRGSILEISRKCNGIVVADEAYIHFAATRSIIDEINRLPNLIVLQTFSKAWAMAGVRVGLAFGDARTIELMNRIKPPYNVSGLAQRAVMAALDDWGIIENWIVTTLDERSKLAARLAGLDYVKTVWPSDANFLLTRVNDAEAVYRFLIGERIVVRNRNRIELCGGCLRITIGTPAENERLIESLQRFSRGEGR